MTNRIGPRMQDVIDLAGYHPGILKIRVAERVGPQGSLFYGYQTIKRTLEAGLIGLANCQDAELSRLDANEEAGGLAGCARPHAQHCHLVPN